METSEEEVAVIHQVVVVIKILEVVPTTTEQDSIMLPIAKMDKMV